jgi:hypothetical protein
LKAPGVSARRLGEPLEEALGRQAGVFGEEAEEDTVEEVGYSLRVVPALAHRDGQARELLGGILGEVLARPLRAEDLRVRHDGAEDPQRLRRVGRQVVEREAVGVRDGAREVRMDLEARQVADDEERRVLERLAVVVQLAVGCGQVLTLALVLPGEVAALPDVGEAIAATELLGTLLEGIPLPSRVDVVRGGQVEHPAQVDEVLLRCGPLGALAAGPLGDELGRRHRP